MEVDGWKLLYVIVFGALAWYFPAPKQPKTYGASSPLPSDASIKPEPLDSDGGPETEPTPKQNVQYAFEIGQVIE